MNNDKTILQIPMTKVLKKKGEQKAQEAGFSSVQEVMRVFLKGYVDGVYNVFIDTSESLTTEAAVRYEKMVREHETDKAKGKVKSYTFDEASKLFE